MSHIISVPRQNDGGGDGGGGQSHGMDFRRIEGKRVCARENGVATCGRYRASSTNHAQCHTRHHGRSAVRARWRRGPEILRTSFVREYYQEGKNRCSFSLELSSVFLLLPLPLILLTSLEFTRFPLFFPSNLLLFSSRSLCRFHQITKTVSILISNTLDISKVLLS